MRAAKGKKRLVIVAAAMLLLVLLALPAGASLPRSAGVADLVDEAAVAHIAPAPTIAPASILPETSAATPRAGPARARLRVHLASPPSWPFSPARVGAFGRAEPKTRVWGFDFGLSGQRQANQWFNPRIAEGVHNGPSMYQFAGYSPANYSDPLGLDSFIVRYGEAESDVDVYTSIRFLRMADDRAMSAALFARGVEGYVDAAQSVWEDLSPQIVSTTRLVSAFMEYGQMYYDYSEDEWVYDIKFTSGPGRSVASEIYADAFESFTFAHEFGHLLGLNDFYAERVTRSPSGGVLTIPYANTRVYGERAENSLMGTGATVHPHDIRDVRDPSVTRFELQSFVDDVHHLDLTGNDVSSLAGFLSRVAKDRDRDITTQLRLLQEKHSIPARRVIVRWAMGALFGPYPQ